jgi:hypothetical protein
MPDPEKTTTGSAVARSSAASAASTTAGSDESSALARLLTEVLTRVQREGGFSPPPLSEKATEAIVRYQITSAALNPVPRAPSAPLT